MITFKNSQEVTWYKGILSSQAHFLYKVVDLQDPIAKKADLKNLCNIIEIVGNMNYMDLPP